MTPRAHVWTKRVLTRNVARILNEKTPAHRIPSRKITMRDEHDLNQRALCYENWHRATPRVLNHALERDDSPRMFGRIASHTRVANDLPAAHRVILREITTRCNAMTLSPRVMNTILTNTRGLNQRAFETTLAGSSRCNTRTGHALGTR